MTKIFLILLCFFISFGVYSQNSTKHIGIADIYVLKAEVIDQVLNAKCPCSMMESENNANCNLYRIKVNDILVHRDTSVFTANELLKVSYLVLKDDEKIELRKEYTFFCKNSSSRDYIIANQVFRNNNYDLAHSSALAYMSGLHSCYSPSFWQKLQLFFSFKKQEKLREFEESSIRKDPFVNYIDGKFN